MLLRLQTRRVLTISTNIHTYVQLAIILLWATGIHGKRERERKQKQEKIVIKASDIQGIGMGHYNTRLSLEPRPLPPQRWMYCITMQELDWS